jgi:hypothetical protein
MSAITPSTLSLGALIVMVELAWSGTGPPAVRVSRG